MLHFLLHLAPKSVNAIFQSLMSFPISDSTLSSNATLISILPIVLLSDDALRILLDSFVPCSTNLCRRLLPNVLSEHRELYLQFYCLAAILRHCPSSEKALLQSTGLAALVVDALHSSHLHQFYHLVRLVHLAPNDQMRPCRLTLTHHTLVASDSCDHRSCPLTAALLESAAAGTSAIALSAIVTRDSRLQGADRVLPRGVRRRRHPCSRYNLTSRTCSASDLRLGRPISLLY